VTYRTPSVSEIRLVAVEGDIDPTTAHALQRRLAIALKLGRGFVAVDLRAVSVDGEPALGLLCDALRDLDRRDARLALAGAPPAMCRMLERAVIDGVELYPTLRAAVAARARRAPA
jgi:anti-anti-sigma regulatory factor